MTQDWNEWLLIDRLGVIKTTFEQYPKPIRLLMTDNIVRDYVLKDLLVRSGVYNIHRQDIGNDIIISSIEANEYEKDSPHCAVKDTNNDLIEFYPMKVCNNEWAEWYFKTYVM